MIRARFALPLALGALGSCCALGDEVILGALKDNTIFSFDADFGTNTSDGAGQRMYVGQTSGAGARRALIAFDIASTVPAGATIDAVSLSFNVTSVHGFQTITLHRLLQDWGEGASNSGLPGGSGAPAKDGDATWLYHHFFSDGSSQPWSTPGGDFNAVQSASGNAAATTFVLSSPTMAFDVTQWRDNPAQNFGWILIGDEQLFAAADRLDSKENSTPNFRPSLVIDYTPAGPPTPEWSVDADGSWGVAGNWGGTAPDSPTAVANLLGKITAPRTITLDGNRTVAELHINSVNSYTISPGTGGVLTFASLGQAVLQVVSGSHFITARLDLGNSTEVNVADGASLTLGGGLQIAQGDNIGKTGLGDLHIGGAQHHGVANLNVLEGKVFLDSNLGTPATASAPAKASLSASSAADAKLALVLSGSENGANAAIILNADQDISELKMSPEAPGLQGLDLNSSATAFHRLRIHSGDMNIVRSSIASYIAHAKASAADGLYDSNLHPNSAIGWGKFVDDNGDAFVLVRPTRIGDLNLDGLVSISDFIDLASNFNGQGFWQEGDLNGDGVVSISDFIDLASNFNGSYAGTTTSISAEDQVALSAFAAAHGVSLVPEPGALAMVIASATLLRRRRAKMRAR